MLKILLAILLSIFSFGSMWSIHRLQHQSGGQASDQGQAGFEGQPSTGSSSGQSSEASPSDSGSSLPLPPAALPLTLALGCYLIASTRRPS